MERVGVGVWCPTEASGQTSFLSVPQSLARLASISVHLKRKLFDFS